MAAIHPHTPMPLGSVAPWLSGSPARADDTLFSLTPAAVKDSTLVSMDTCSCSLSRFTKTNSGLICLLPSCCLHNNNNLLFSYLKQSVARSVTRSLQSVECKSLLLKRRQQRKGDERRKKKSLPYQYAQDEGKFINMHEI
jgi:hypothetical protein